MKNKIFHSYHNEPDIVKGINEAIKRINKKRINLMLQDWEVLKAQVQCAISHGKDPKYLIKF